MRKCLLVLVTYTLAFALALAPTFAQSTQSTQGPPKGGVEPPFKPPAVLPKPEDPATAARPDPERAEKLRKLDEMKTLRNTGANRLSQAEIDDFLEENGIKKTLPRFSSRPVCEPVKDGDVCGVRDLYHVGLNPKVMIKEAKATAALLLTKYNMELAPNGYFETQSPTGASFLAHGSEEQAKKLSQDPLVRYVVQEEKFKATDLRRQEKPRQLTKEQIGKIEKRKAELGLSGLDNNAMANKLLAQVPQFYWFNRIDQHNLPLSGPTNGDFNRPNWGTGVDIYLYGYHFIETHQELTTTKPGLPLRSDAVFDFFPDSGFQGDCQKDAHDTRVASVAAGRTVGVAPGANIYGIVPVKFPSQAITLTAIINSVDYMVTRIGQRRPHPAIAMTASAWPGSSVNSIADSHIANIFSVADTLLVSAAGEYQFQSDTPASFWPDRCPNILKVGYTDSQDRECSRNNGDFGNPCGSQSWTPVVDLFAPGLDIWAADIVGCGVGIVNPDYQSLTIHFTGTSAAVGIVGGIGALIEGANQTYWPHWYQTRDILKQMSSFNVVQTTHTGIPRNMVYDSYNSLPVPTSAASYVEGGSPGGMGAAFAKYAGISPDRVTVQTGELGQEVGCYVFSGSTLDQVNFVLPDTLGNETHYFRVYTGNFLHGISVIKTNTVLPAFFTVGQSGQGTVSGLMYKYNTVTGTLAQTVGLTDDGAGTNWTSDQTAYLVLFGTGWKKGTSFSAKIDGTSIPVQFAGAQGTYIGLDQVNIGPLPTGLKNSGTHGIKITANGVDSTVGPTVKFAASYAP